MGQNEKLKLFISYSHLDNDEDKEAHVTNFRKHITPLKTDDLIEDWYDRKILSGQEFQENIDNNLEDANIICLFISANFLSAEACMQEKKRAIELKKKKGVVVIPIILSLCGWKDDKDIKKLLALPTDGKPITEFTNPDKAWNDVYEGLKKIIVQEIKIKQLRITNDFSNFLQDAELLTKAHSQKEEVFFDDIFIYPELTKYEVIGELEKKISSEDFIKDIINYSKILIAGENQSGKTTLCKKIFIELRENNFVPIYVSDKNNQYQGKIDNKISKAYKKQYEGIEIDKIDKKRIVPIIDDFHLAKNKEKHIHDLSKYDHLIITVDDIFSLNIKDETLISSFTSFKLNEFTPSLRHELIKKWSYLSDKKDSIIQDASDVNENYKKIDQRIEFVDTALGKALGKGIMPAYPFFILSVIATYETFRMPLDQEITSQGYCYQALIYLYLRKQGVKNDEIDTYVNFLAEFAFHLFKENKNELSNSKFEFFMESYLEKFNFPIKQEILLRNIRRAQISSSDNFNNHSFRYPYIYYFFVAKYLAEHRKDNKKIISSIIENLHKDANAYIAIFIAHHSKNIEFLDEIISNVRCFFDKYKPATLTKVELNFFDEQADIIVKAVLPPSTTTPEKERAEILKMQDRREEINEQQESGEEENDDDLSIELRRSIKTVEVLGSIIKNRAGSLEKNKLEEIFEEAMKVHFRILTLLFELIRDEEIQKEIGDFISKRLSIEEKTKHLSHEQMEKMSKKIFWNINFFTIYGFVVKIIHSLGSDKLEAIAEKVCDNEKTPSSFLVTHGIFMWYDKNLQIDNITKRIAERDFSKIAEAIIKFMIVNHVRTHQTSYRDRQRIESKLRIPKRKLLKSHEGD
jgi:hypothetical protein